MRITFGLTQNPDFLRWKYKNTDQLQTHPELVEPDGAIGCKDTETTDCQRKIVLEERTLNTPYAVWLAYVRLVALVLNPALNRNLTLIVT